MTRWFAILALAFAFATPMAFDADAGNLKRCKGKSLAGKTVTFVCKGKQKCCFGALSGTGYCGKGDFCF